MDQTQREFLTEIQDLIEAILDDVDVLHSQREESGFRRELLARIFRRAHSVKGLAVSIGLDQLSEIAHEFENLLEAVRPGSIEMTATLLDTFEAAGNALSESLAAAETGAAGPSSQELFDRIHNTIQESTKGSNTDLRPAPRLPDNTWRSLTQEEIRHLVDATVAGANLFVVKSSFALADFDERFYRLKEALSETGEVIAVSPAARSDLPGRITFRILYAAKLNIAALEKGTADFEDVTINEIGDPNSSQESSALAESRLDLHQPATSSISSSSIRVDLKDLDALISLTHDLFRETGIAVDAAISQAQPPPGIALAANANRIRETFLKLENDLINLRMVCIDRVLKRAMRAGRAAARLAQKEIDFEIRGIDLRLDKHLSDAIADPLLHLVRNAVDHGIETKEQRLAAGKTERGRVRIEALEKGNRMQVRVTDDGGGVDPEIVSRTAARIGIIDQNTVLDMERSLRLIFRTGFSTASSNLSGRGVGLDVVETGVEQVGGEVAVWSEGGLGSCFEIRLPLTFGLLRSLVVVSSGNLYCIDAAQVVKSEKIESGEIKESEGAKVLQLDEQLVPLVWMRKLLGQPEPAPGNTQLNVITCEFHPDTPQSPAKEIAIVVDGIEGPEEVLVRNLGRHAGRWQGVVGATELRSGSVALVLDVPSLL